MLHNSLTPRPDSEAQQHAGVLSFEQAYQRYAPAITRHVYALVQHKEQAEDLTQDTFLKAYRARVSMPTDPQEILYWLSRIATNTVIDARRRARLVSWQELLEEHAAGTDFQQHCETRILVRQALSQLPERYRAALLLRYVDGYSPAEVAQRLQRGPAGIKMHLLRARRCFQRTYEEVSA